MVRSQLLRPLARSIRPSPTALRTITTTPARSAEVTTDKPTETAAAAAAAAAPPVDVSNLDPNTALPEDELSLYKAGLFPIGSRRRRLAIRSTDDIPFEHLPFQTFQEARKILAADREAKVKKIAVESDKIRKLQSIKDEEFKGGKLVKAQKIESLEKLVEKLKLQADINDPVVKKRYEDGLGDMTKPIYRHYAQQKWLGYPHRLITQRIDQFNIVPDILPALKPTIALDLSFRGQKCPPGTIIDSAVSEFAPTLRVQSFEKGEKLVSVIVMDADVPDPENDSFTKKCHFMAGNIKLGPETKSIALGSLKKNDIAVSWTPPTAQKGSPYHRLAVFILEQKDASPVDIEKMRKLYTNPPTPDTTEAIPESSSTSDPATINTPTLIHTTAPQSAFSLKSCRDIFSLSPIGFSLFRSVWDENTASVMARHGIAGAETELRPARVYSMKPPVKPRGWEAKRQGPKYRQLWKYTKRIRGVSNGRGWIKRR